MGDSLARLAFVDGVETHYRGGKMHFGESLWVVWERSPSGSWKVIDCYDTVDEAIAALLHKPGAVE